jgi:type III restriction enzyme
MTEIKFKDVINLPKELKIPAKKQAIPGYVTSNLKYDLFEWQTEALKYFLAYCENKSDIDSNPYTHLMFNLATGAGKTLLMASSILYYYKQGYRNFLFFVNQNNIVDKTEQNLANKYHPKYLFSQDIVIDGKQVEIRNVDSFSDGQDGIIEIKFTSINKFYNDIHLEKENINTLDDLHQKNIVMLADEAHHLNANTKSFKEELFDKIEELKDNAGADKIEKLGWEHTVIDLVLKKNNTKNENKNVLLEFTATIPNNTNVVEKYKDKTIYCFDLKDFLSKGYTKQINLLSSQSDKKNRILIALLFNWYRHKIALENNIPNFKSVILFRSKLIEESKEDFEFFQNLIENLTQKDIENLKQESNINKSDNKLIHEQANDRFSQIWQYIAKENIELQEVVNFIQSNFQERNLIITNSKSGTKTKEKTTDEQEALLNNLEQKDNPIRAIFTVDRLTEGWDVLNLFDIVRLYQGQNAGGSDNKTPQTTIKEKQLIGRGVRYFPFQYQDKEQNKRKFDNDLKNELRVLEELFYHTYDEESRYISHLKTELKKDGYITDNKEVVEFDLKEEFKKSDFYKNVKILKNEKIANPDKRKNTLESIKNDTENILEHNLTKSNLKQESLEGKSSNISNDSKQETIIFNKIIDRHILRKALSKSKNLDFTRLSNELEVKSVEELLTDRFFGDVNIKLTVRKSVESINNQEKLKIAIHFLDWFDKKIKEYSHLYIGTKEFKLFDFAAIFSEPKRKVIDKDEIKKIESHQDGWYILNKRYINSEEQECLNDIQENLINKIKDKTEIYLLRNEEVYKIFNFKDGQGFQPDFMIFIKGKDSCYYQILVESKGGQFKDANSSFDNSKEGWKQDCLLELEKLNNGEGFSFENKYYKLIGLPFYNKDSKKDCLDKIDKIRNKIVEV